MKKSRGGSEPPPRFSLDPLEPSAALEEANDGHSEDNNHAEKSGQIGERFGDFSHANSVRLLIYIAGRACAQGPDRLPPTRGKVLIHAPRLDTALAMMPIKSHRLRVPRRFVGEPVGSPVPAIDFVHPLKTFTNDRHSESEDDEDAEECS